MEFRRELYRTQTRQDKSLASGKKKKKEKKTNEKKADSKIDETKWRVRKRNEVTTEDISLLPCQDIYGVLRHLSGVRINGNKISINEASSINSGTDPLIIVNGVPVTSVDDIVSIQDIKSIKVEKTSTMYGVRGANGALIIVTN